MGESNIFIAYQSESDGAASTCKQALIDQGWSDGEITMWNRSSPWAEPIFEVGRKIMRANVVIVISRTGGRRSSWVQAEVTFARRVGVPVLYLSETKARRIEAKQLRQVMQKGRYRRLIDVQPLLRRRDLYDIHVYEELTLLELSAADPSQAFLSNIRRRLITFETDVRIAFAYESMRFTSSRSIFTFMIFANLINPRGMICNLVFRPIVRWAEKRGSLPKLEPSPEFGKWRDELPTFIGNPAPFFENFGTSYSAQQLWGWDDITIDLLEQAAENQKSQLKETGETESEEET